MAVLLGRNSRILKNNVVVAKMTSMSLTIGEETIDVTSFGDQWMKYAIGMSSWTASISGFYIKDSTEQNALRAANINRTEITDLKFAIEYSDSTAQAYYECDTVTDAEAACIIDSMTVTSDNNSVVAFDMSVTGSGPIRYLTL